MLSKILHYFTVNAQIYRIILPSFILAMQKLEVKRKIQKKYTNAQPQDTNAMTKQSGRDSHAAEERVDASEELKSLLRYMTPVICVKRLHPSSQ